MAITKQQAEYFAELAFAIKDTPQAKKTDLKVTLDGFSGGKSELATFFEASGNEKHLKSVFTKSDNKDAAIASFGGDAAKQAEFERHMTEIGLDGAKAAPAPAKSGDDKGGFKIPAGGAAAAVGILGFILTPGSMMSKMTGASKWAAAAGALGIGANTLAGDAIPDMLEQVARAAGVKDGDISKMFSEGLGGLLGGLGSGAGGLMGGLGDTLSSLMDDDSIGGLFKKGLSLIKDQPLVAAAIGYGLHKMFKNGLSFGGVFSGLPSLAMGLAVAWVASSVLGIGDNKNQGIIADRSDEVSAGQLASQNAAPSRSPQVAS